MRRNNHITVLALSQIIMFVFFIIVPVTHGQKINSTKPGVYLSFKEYTENTPSAENDSVGVRLILHNNTRWTIFYTRLMQSSLPKDVPVSYIIELTTGCRVERFTTDVIMTSKIMPGKTVSFVVPKSEFSVGSKVYVEFFYSWEPRLKKTHQIEAVHRAYFASSHLPFQNKTNDDR